MSRRRPGNGSATLLDMLSNLFYFSLFLSREGSAPREEERRGGRERERDDRRRRGEAHPPPLTCYPPHTSTPFSNIASSERSRSLTLSPPSPSPPPLHHLPLVSSRFFVLFSRRKRKWKRGTKREKGKKGARWAARAGGGCGGGERERGATASFGCNERTE